MWFPNPYFIPRLAAIIKRYLKTQREEDKKNMFHNTDLYPWEFKYKCSTTSTSIHLRQADIHSFIQQTFTESLLCVRFPRSLPDPEDIATNKVLARMGETSNNTTCSCICIHTHIYIYICLLYKVLSDSDKCYIEK